MIAIFDIGKTNQKLFAFNEDYKVVFEKTVQLPEIKDEDGFSCEDVQALSHWVITSLKELLNQPAFSIKAVNVSAHGAAFVNIGDDGKPVTPLYNYLKPFPDDLREEFYDYYGGDNFAVQTASPVLGNLNSGMQLLWLRRERPDAFKKIKYALHLPEYISFLMTGKPVSGITSIGCHTNLWDFSKNTYHDWVWAESIFEKLAPIRPSDETIAVKLDGHHLHCGIGLHDSSSALIPYLKTFREPFVLLSTGTWNISLNPFNTHPLTSGQLRKDCLCYLSFEGKPVKASRLFAGHDHDEEVKLLSKKYNKPEDAYKKVKFDAVLLNVQTPTSFEEAYHLLVLKLAEKQKELLELVMTDETHILYVDGGFCENEIFIKLLAQKFPSKKIFTAELHQASALGAALAIHASWNPKPIPTDLISLRSMPY